MTDLADLPALPVLLAFALLGLAAVPGVAAADVEATDPDPNPCRPYPDDPDVVTEAWCMAKGIGNATVILFENVWDGNYTTLQDYREGIAQWREAVESCSGDPGDPRCPALAWVTW